MAEQSIASPGSQYGCQTGRRGAPRRLRRTFKRTHSASRPRVQQNVCADVMPSSHEGQLVPGTAALLLPPPGAPLRRGDAAHELRCATHTKRRTCSGVCSAHAGGEAHCLSMAMNTRPQCQRPCRRAPAPRHMLTWTHASNACVSECVYMCFVCVHVSCVRPGGRRNVPAVRSHSAPQERCLVVRPLLRDHDGHLGHVVAVAWLHELDAPVVARRVAATAAGH
mmetsp:Transcript_3820/g.10897  ORF Transcript_3820/g.10897 Transcript_3820/m.10897 type:complete len:223 (+) Transcript_3820:719-1387(+)